MKPNPLLDDDNESRIASLARLLVGEPMTVVQGGRNTKEENVAKRRARRISKPASGSDDPEVGGAL